MTIKEEFVLRQVADTWVVFESEMSVFFHCLLTIVCWSTS